MIKIRNISICVLTFVCLLTMLFPFCIPVSAQKPDRYGYTLLTNENQRIAYKAIAEGLAVLDTEITFTIEGITGDNINAVVTDVTFAEEMVVTDYPEYFWFYGGGAVSISGNSVTFTPVAYTIGGQPVTADSDSVRSAKQQMKNVIKDALAKLPKNPSDYEIAHALHDFVVEKASYTAGVDHQTAYGALVGGEAVCAGYARAYQLLLNEAGILCWYVAGQSYDPNGQLVTHAWNLVWLDGMCYYTDVTWDDQGRELFHEYLNLSLEEISKTHFTDHTLPDSCGHDTYTFFKMSDGSGVCDIRDHKQASEVADCFQLKSLEGKKATYYCTIHYHGDDFGKWIQDNIAAITKELGYISVDTVNLIELGLEHHVTITGELSAAPAETTKPTEPSVPAETTKPTEPSAPAETTKPTEPSAPAETTKPTEPSVPAETTKPTEPSVPAETTKPTEPSVPAETRNPTEPSAPAETTKTTEPSAPAETTKPADTTEPTASSVPAGTSEPADSSQSDQTAKPNEDPGKTIMIVLLAAAGCGGIGTAVYFLFIRKKL